VALTAALAACSGGSRHASDLTTRSTGVPSSTTRITSLASSSPTPSPLSEAERQAVAAYDAMWHDMAVAARTADYRSPLLPQHATRTALATLIHGLYSYKRQGLIIKGTPVTHPRVTSAQPSSAPTHVKIVDCFDDTHWLNYKSTGGLQDKIPGGHRRVTAVAIKQQFGWKVTELSVGDEGSC
jgi:hypothetical protein